MRVTSLAIANFRSIEAAQFAFEPGFNLIVGVNGAGKSTVLEALRVCASRVLPLVSPSRSQPLSFATEDIRFGFPFLDVSLAVKIGDQDFRLTRHQRRDAFDSDSEENVEGLRRQILESERLRERPRKLLRDLVDSHGALASDTFVPDEAALTRAASDQGDATNFILFATNRSAMSYATKSATRLQASAVGGTSAAYAEALTPRSLYVAQFALWLRAQQDLATERPLSARHLEVLREAVARFLPEYEDLRPSDEDPSHLVVNRGSAVLDVGQLSDGERGVLALVLDLARRLSQGNPSLADPLAEGEAVVLIDEIDLHLHPKWQREIADNLTTTFPRCQFIATTHSPQVIGQIEHGRIQVIDDGRVYRPSHSFGVDSSRVLEEVMNAASRDLEVDGLLSDVSRLIGERDMEQARKTLGTVASMLALGESDPDIVRLQTLVDLMDESE